MKNGYCDNPTVSSFRVSLRIQGSTAKNPAREEEKKGIVTPVDNHPLPKCKRHAVATAH